MLAATTWPEALVTISTIIGICFMFWVVFKD